MSDILDSNDWAQEANQRLRLLNSFPPRHGAIVLLRHSHRLHSSTSEVTVDVPLTNEGRQAALEFGSKLPANQTYRLFHSRVNRCKETAELITKGLATRGIRATNHGSLFVITTIATHHPQVSRLYRRDRHQSIYKWAAGHYTQAVIEPFTSYVQRAANIIWSQHLASPATIDLYITHDFHLMALQFGWSGLIFPEEWVSYLGGFILRLEADLMHFYKTNHVQVPYPEWWPLTP